MQLVTHSTTQDGTDSASPATQQTLPYGFKYRPAPPVSFLQPSTPEQLADQLHSAIPVICESIMGDVKFYIIMAGFWDRAVTGHMSDMPNTRHS